VKTTESFRVRQPVNLRTTPLRSRSPRALTLVEVMVSMSVLTLTTLGILGAFIQSRNTTSFQKSQMLVETLVHGVIEQLKSRSATDLLPSVIPRATSTAAPANCLSSMADLVAYISEGNTAPSVAVELDTNMGNAASLLILSPYPYISPDNITPGATPADVAPTAGNGYGDINGDGADDVGVNTILLDVKGTNGLDGSINDTSDDIRVNLMIWILDSGFSQSNAATGGTTRILSRGIYINYTWTYTDGRTTRRMIGSARAISKPTRVEAL
jgi:hypothetical protein